MEGAIVFALTAALKSAITLDKGRVHWPDCNGSVDFILGDCAEPFGRPE